MSTPCPIRALDERLNVATHGVGLIVAAAAAWLLADHAASALAQVVTAGFAFGLFAAFGASTLFHLAVLRLLTTEQVTARRIAVTQALLVADHAGILILVVGSYVPFALLGVGGSTGWTLFGFVGIGVLATLAALVGTSARRRIDLFERFAPVAYLSLGWGPLVLFWSSIREAIPPLSFDLILAGGVAYSVGVGAKSMTRLRFNHALWHLMVVLASALHAGAVFALVAAKP